MIIRLLLSCFCSKWYNVAVSGSDVLLQSREDLLQHEEVHEHQEAAGATVLFLTRQLGKDMHPDHNCHMMK
jgi:hypothetical protein